MATGTPREEQYLLDNVFQDGQGLSSISEQDLRDFVASVKYMNGHGWDFHYDGQYTAGAPRTILAGVRTKITIDGATEDVGHPVTTHTSDHFWDPSLNKLAPPAVNDFGVVRFAMTASSIAPTNYLEVELDTGGSFPIIFQETKVFSKGAGINHHFNSNMTLFAGPDFVANGAEIYVTPLADITVWDQAITTCRLYLARP